MSEFYSIRKDDLIRLLADHFEMVALDNAGVERWDWYDEAIRHNLEGWRETMGIKELPEYDDVAEYVVTAATRPAPQKFKQPMVMDKNFWIEEWA